MIDHAVWCPHGEVLVNKATGQQLPLRLIQLQVHASDDMRALAKHQSSAKRQHSEEVRTLHSHTWHPAHLACTPGCVPLTSLIARDNASRSVPQYAPEHK